MWTSSDRQGFYFGGFAAMQWCGGKGNFVFSLLFWFLIYKVLQSVWRVLVWDDLFFSACFMKIRFVLRPPHGSLTVLLLWSLIISSKEKHSFIYSTLWNYELKFMFKCEDKKVWKGENLPTANNDNQYAVIQYVVVQYAVVQYVVILYAVVEYAVVQLPQSNLQ